MLILAGDLIVTGAKGIAVALGMDAFVIGATIVAIGTSVPELATTVISKLRGHDEVGLGTILGSNIFNGLFIISVAAVIHPITVGWRELALTLAVGLVALLFAYPPRGGFIRRSRGILLLLLYVGYVVAILQHKPA
jgi:cation:H+ antiporter